MTHGQILAVTMGEPAGIGPEITLDAWAHRTAWAQQDKADLACFYLIADPRHMVRIATRIASDIPIIEIARPEEAPDAFTKGLPVLPVTLDTDVIYGTPQPDTAAAVIRSIDTAVSHVLDGRADAIITNPIQKAALYDAGFKHPGHTEYLAQLCKRSDDKETPTPLMMLMVPGLRVVPLTIHVPLRKVASMLTCDWIADTARALSRALEQDFGVAHPRVAIAGLNPHAGESGKLGREEVEIIAPAVRALQQEGLNITGPWPADTLFHAKARRHHDAVLCMYHDQALIPLKTIDFDHGVNVTLGLPIVRTSPDHGTAFDLAGTGKASPKSLIAALQAAANIAQRRKTVQSK